MRVYTKFEAGFDGTTEGPTAFAFRGIIGAWKIPMGGLLLYTVENSVYYGEAYPGPINVYAYHPGAACPLGDHFYLPAGLPIDKPGGELRADLRGHARISRHRPTVGIVRDDGQAHTPGSAMARRGGRGSRSPTFRTCGCVTDKPEDRRCNSTAWQEQPCPLGQEVVRQCCHRRVVHWPGCGFVAGAYQSPGAVRLLERR